jgi:hypothetical protein
MDATLWDRYQMYVARMQGSDEYILTYDEWLECP